MTRLVGRAYAAKEKRNAELKEIRRKAADFVFNTIVHLTVVLLGLGVLFGLYILFASILGPILGIDLLESESAAAKRWKEQSAAEYVLEEVNVNE